MLTHSPGFVRNATQASTFGVLKESRRALTGAFENAYAFSRLRSKCNSSVDIRRAQGVQARLTGAFENAYAFSRLRSKCNSSVDIRRAQEIQARLTGAFENAYAFSRLRSKCNSSVDIRRAQEIQARLTGAFENAYAFSRLRSKCNSSVDIRRAQEIQARLTARLRMLTHSPVSFEVQLKRRHSACSRNPVYTPPPRFVVPVGAPQAASALPDRSRVRLPCRRRDESFGHSRPVARVFVDQRLVGPRRS